MPNQPWWAQPNAVTVPQQPVMAMPAQQNNMANYSQSTQNVASQQATSPFAKSQVTQPPSVFPGKFITSEKDIDAKDVLMEAPLSLFPSNNFDYIIAKAWNSQGTIDTVVYVPQQQAPKEPKEDPFEKLNARLDRIEKSLSYRRKPYNKNYHQNGGKKEETEG